VKKCSCHGDVVLRCFILGFRDVVNRLSWNHVAFSSMGEYVMASTNKSHDIYVWERSQGSLVKTLEEPVKELGVVKGQFMNTHTFLKPIIC
jgi:hypothetical protein